MMLWESELEDAVILTKSYVSDGRGGTIETYTEGLTVSVAFTFLTSPQMRIAEQTTAVPRYTLTTHQNVNLQFHDVIKRKRDGMVFRVTSKGDDNKSPKVATLDMRQVEAEEWVLPNG